MAPGWEQKKEEGEEEEGQGRLLVVVAWGQKPQDLDDLMMIQLPLLHPSTVHCFLDPMAYRPAAAHYVPYHCRALPARPRGSTLQRGARRRGELPLASAVIHLHSLPSRQLHAAYVHRYGLLSRPSWGECCRQRQSVAEPEGLVGFRPDWTAVVCLCIIA